MPKKHVHFSDDRFHDVTRPPTPPPQYLQSSPPSSPGPVIQPSLGYYGSGHPSSAGPVKSFPLPDYHGSQSYILHPALRTSNYSTHVLYDVSRLPSTVQFHSSVSLHVLSESVTHPPLPSMKITLEHLPWVIMVMPTAYSRAYVSVADLLDAIFHTLRVPVSQVEYRAIPTRDMQQRVMVAYEQRCQRVLDTGEYERERAGGLRRVDFLMERNIFAGLGSTPHGPDVWELDLTDGNLLANLKHGQEGGGKEPLAPEICEFFLKGQCLLGGRCTRFHKKPEQLVMATPSERSTKKREDAGKQVVRGTGITSGGTESLSSRMINVVTDSSSSLASKTSSSPASVTPPLRLDESNPHQTRNLPVSTSNQNEGGLTTGSRSTECPAFRAGHCAKGQNCRFSHEPKVLPEDDAGGGEEKSLEDEASEAAFVVCWPQGRSTPSSQTTRSPDDFPCFSSSWDGGCVLSVHDSDLVDIWIDLNYEHQFLVQLREKSVGGPLASMLSVESPALTIFGAMSVELIRMANELAELSGLPVIVRPLEEDPSPRFRNYEQSTLSPTPNTDGGDGNTGQHVGAQSSISAHSSSQNQRANDPAGGAKKGNLGKQRQDDTGSEDEGEDPSDPDPPPPSVPPATKGEIIHRADITLTVLINNEDKGHFLRVITNAKTYPLPNPKTQSENRGSKKVASEPSIQGHVYLETRSSESVQIDVAAGSVGFLANNPDYLRTEYLVSLGYDQPPRKFNIENSSQISKSLSTSFGLVGGKPTAAFGLSAGKLTGTMMGLADEEVAKPWIVSPQHGNDNWETDGSCYRSLSANINRSPPGEYQASKCPMVPDINVEYGMAVEVAESISKETPLVSFVYRHQIHCWVAVESRAKVRGMIVLTAHYIPDIRTEKPLWISSRPSMNITCKDIQQDSSSSSKQVAAVQDGNTGLMAAGTSDDRFIFSAATTPEPDVGTKPLAFFNRFLSGGPNSKGRKGVEQVEPVPMHGLVFRGWNRKDIGWDHREQRWYHPVWQKLDPALLPDESRAKWKLDWEHEG